MGGAGCTGLIPDGDDGGQNGSGTEKPGNGSGEGSSYDYVVKSLSASDGEFTFTAEFEYDDKGRLVKMKSSEDGDIILEYPSASEVKIISPDESYMPYYTVTLDAEGRAISIREEDTDYDDGIYNLSYEDGYLTEIRNDGYSEKWIGEWEDGRLVSAKYEYSSGDGEKYTYSEYKNNTNLDLNWLLSGSYYCDFDLEGAIGLLGKRCRFLVNPKPYGDYEVEDEPRRTAIPESDNGKTFTYTTTDYEYGQDRYDFVLDGEKVTKVTLTIPVTKTEKEVTERYRIVGEPLNPEDPGEKYYEYETDFVSERTLKEEKYDERSIYAFTYVE